MLDGKKRQKVQKKVILQTTVDGFHQFFLKINQNLLYSPL
jgi:hypothetical protein